MTVVSETRRAGERSASGSGTGGGGVGSGGGELCKTCWHWLGCLCPEGEHPQPIAQSAPDRVLSQGSVPVVGDEGEAVGQRLLPRVG